MPSQQSFDFVVFGAGGRGKTLAAWIHQHPQAGRVVAVADPDPERRNTIATWFNLSDHQCFDSYEQVLARPRMADVIINTLMDRLHAPSAIPALDMGYHMLLEKPMAVTLDDCIAIDAAQKRNRSIVAVCHSLRYHQVYREVHRLLRSGAIGDLVSFDQLEAVEPAHQAHSFVRGNWGNESRSTFMLMAKSCHDIDILAWLVDRPCRKVSSFGNLNYFHKAYAPAGATPRCTDGCPHEPTCKYSAIKAYLHTTEGWMQAHADIRGDTYEQRFASLHASPYGRCVWQCDNDVVDHQVVAFEFAGGVTGTFTMTAFHHPGNRHLRLHGTQGQIEASVSDNTIRLRRFADNALQTTVIPAQSGSHGGSDSNIMASFVQALRKADPNAVATTTEQSLASHRIVFAAELARRQGCVMNPEELATAEQPLSPNRHSNP
jgi:predicted dehydrogenase